MCPYMNMCHLVLRIGFFFVASVLMSAAGKPERIRSNALYFPDQAKADAVKKLWPENIVREYKFLVGSSEDRDYVAAKPIEASRPANVQGPGKVFAMVLLNADGQPIATRVIDSTERKLELPVLEALHRWTFEPARYKTKKVMSAVLVPFEFGP
jgi:hypothetical protein